MKNSDSNYLFQNKPVPSVMNTLKANHWHLWLPFLTWRVLGSWRWRIRWKLESFYIWSVNTFVLLLSLDTVMASIFYPLRNYQNPCLDICFIPGLILACFTYVIAEKYSRLTTLSMLFKVFLLLWYISYAYYGEFGLV